MGCDIHAFIEKKIEGRWELFAELHWDRSYSVFSRLAGVRGEHDPIEEPRGFPDNVSYSIKQEFAEWEKGYHTTSWYNLSEIKDDKILNGLNFKEWIRPFIFEVHKYRLIFWFDS